MQFGICEGGEKRGHSRGDEFEFQCIIINVCVNLAKSAVMVMERRGRRILKFGIMMKMGCMWTY